MPSISAQDIHVEFPLYDSYARSLRHTLGLGRIAKGINRIASRSLNVGGQIGKGEAGRIVVKALDGVSLDIREGDRIAIVGHNGSGKTTFLRTLAGIYEPIRGTIDINGRIIPLFELSLGMDLDATGIENIWLRGKMLDLTTRQIKDALDDIANFTELADYLYMPIRTYSAGMFVRLAFGISTAITPDILILDEMIGAGDASFKDRAIARLKEFIAKAGILVIASHDTSMLYQWCNRAVLLEHGKLLADGPVDQIVTHYRRTIAG